MEIRKIANYLPKVESFNQRNPLYIVISSVALTIFYLYRTVSPSSDFFIKKNLEAIKQKWDLTRLFFRSFLEKQEATAKNMANKVIPFPHFEERKQEENLGKFSRESPPLDSFSRVDLFTKKNLDAIKQKWYLTRLLFRGSLEKQEAIAKNMANDLGIPFHHFDGRELEGNLGKFNKLLQRIFSGEKPEFVFVSHADEICCKDNSALNIILCCTGDVSQKLLLCLGVSLKGSLTPALASRYGGGQLIIEE